MAEAGGAWGGLGRFEVYVDGGQVVEVLVEEGFRDPPRGVMFGPVERLFAIVESVPSVDLQVEYDPQWGSSSGDLRLPGDRRRAEPSWRSSPPSTVRFRSRHHRDRWVNRHSRSTPHSATRGCWWWGS